MSEATSIARVEDYKPPRRFRPVRFRDIPLNTSRAYLVKDLVPREGLIVVWGPPKCGKSFFTFDLMMHVALDWSYRGRRVDTGPIVYVACEGERGFGARAEAFRQARLGEDRSDPPLYLLTTRLDLVAETDALRVDIEAELGDRGCSAIIIDTLNRSLAGSESSDEDMSAYVRAADRLREAFSCAVIVVHHCGINDQRPRGHTSLTGAVDAQIAVKKDTAGQVIATVEYMKDGPEGDEIVSRLKVVEVGIDEDGDAITSCVVDEGTATESEAAARTRKPLPSAAKVGFEQLKNCMADHAIDLPASAHVPTGIRGVTLTHWRDYLEKAAVINREGNPREQFRRIRVTLQDRGFIGVWGDSVWLSHAVT